jgi:hypothetical protein
MKRCVSACEDVSKILYMSISRTAEVVGLIDRTVSSLGEMVTLAAISLEPTQVSLMAR